jgi:hypothetical protein
MCYYVTSLITLTLIEFLLSLLIDYFIIIINYNKYIILLILFLFLLKS